MGTVAQVSLLGLLLFAATVHGPRSAQTTLIYEIYEKREVFAPLRHSGHRVPGLTGLCVY